MFRLLFTGLSDEEIRRLISGRGINLAPKFSLRAADKFIGEDEKPAVFLDLGTAHGANAVFEPSFVADYFKQMFPKATIRAWRYPSSGSG